MSIGGLIRFIYILQDLKEKICLRHRNEKESCKSHFNSITVSVFWGVMTSCHGFSVGRDTGEQSEINVYIDGWN